MTRPAVWWCGILLVGGTAALNCCARRDVQSSAHGKQLVILGIDGMDPGFLERHWDDLPNLNRLRREGDFRRLQTTTPPQSPVAWSTFITGMDPGGHGIYDFVERRPETLGLFSSMAQTTEGGHRISLGPYRLPVSSGHVRNLRGGTAFWRILAEHGVPVTILRMPTNFPPLPYGRAVAGMGTPDLLGTFGTFTFYTDDPLERTRDVPGGRIVNVTVDPQNRVLLPIAGPPNSLRADQA
ncbi:MAG: alkaline phosphatase family protein, partial [Bryobacteraceae bacterium]